MVSNTTTFDESKMQAPWEMTTRSTNQDTDATQNNDQRNNSSSSNRAMNEIDKMLCVERTQHLVAKRL